MRQAANPVVTTAERAAEQIAVASTGVYVALRSINAFLSTAQEVEIGASMVGQASMQPLKVLEPVDDTIERVASAIFLVAAASALAAVAMGPIVSVGLVVLGLGLIGLSATGHSPRYARIAAPMCHSGVSFGIVVAFLIPLFFAFGVWIGERATETRMNEAVMQLKDVAGQASAIVGAEDGAQAGAETLDAAEGQGLLKSLQGELGRLRDIAVDTLAESVRYVTAGRVFLTEADTIFAASLTIIGVFILRMVVLPVFMVLGALALLRRAKAPAAE